MKKKPQHRPLREQIAALALIRALEAHVLGEKKMSPSQVSAALALLRKRLPDLARRYLPPRRRKKDKTEDTSPEDALKELQ